MANYATAEDSTGYSVKGYFLSTSSAGYTRSATASYERTPGANFSTYNGSTSGSIYYEQTGEYEYSSTESAATNWSGSNSNTRSYITKVGETPNTTIKTLTTTNTYSGSSSASDTYSMTRNLTGATDGSSSTTSEFYIGYVKTTSYNDVLEFNTTNQTKETLSISYLKISESFNKTTSQSNYTTFSDGTYNVIVTSRSANYTSTITDLTSSEYTTSSTLQTVINLTNVQVTGFSFEHTSSKVESPSGTYVPNTVILVNRTNAWGGQLWVWKQNKSGAFSECFEKVNNLHTLPASLKTEFASVATFGSSPTVTKSTKKFEPPAPQIDGANSTKNSVLYATYLDYSFTALKTISLFLAANYSSSIWYLDRTTTKSDKADFVFDLDASRLSSTGKTTSFNYTVNTTTTNTANGGLTTESRAKYFGSLFTTTKFKIKQFYETTVVFTRSLDYIEFKSYSSSTQTSSSAQNSTISQPTMSAFAAGGSTIIQDGLTASSLISSSTVPVELTAIVDNREQFRFTCLKPPSGFIGFAGTFDYTKISSSYAYRSIKSNKLGRIPRNAIEFNLFDLNENLFVLAREDGTVIIPQTVQEFPQYGFTVSAVPPKNLQTSMELTVIYSTSYDTTVSSSTSSSTIYTYSGITKTRGSGLSFTTGSTSRQATYSIFSSTQTKTTTQLDTAITYKYSLDKKLNATKFFTVGYATTSIFDFAGGIQVTYGMVGGGNTGDTVLSVGPVLLKYTLDDTNGKSVSGKKSMTNVSTTNMLTIKEGSFMYFEAHPLFTTLDYPAYNRRWFPLDEYNFQ